MLISRRLKPKIKKIIVLCFLQLLKLKKIKCLYFFILWLVERDMAIFCFRGPFDYYFIMENQENGHIFANKTRNEKIKALYFLQLLKLEEIKCSYFFILWLIGRDMVMTLFSKQNIWDFKGK